MTGTDDTLAGGDQPHDPAGVDQRHTLAGGDQRHTVGPAERYWRDRLVEWAIPPRILEAVADSPWTAPTAVFARRADAATARPTGKSWRIAAAALPGQVLDVGAGAGAASLPLGARMSLLTAVDTNAGMLAALADRAAAAKLPTRVVLGRWPDIAAEVPPADVVVCHHVFYNAANLGAFATALTVHARRRVVVELTPHHPMRPLNPLWTAMHGVARPNAPTWMDAVEVLREIGLAPSVRRWPRPPRPPYASFAELIATTRRRLCLPAERDPELAHALVALGVDPVHPRDLGTGEPDELVTLWWDI
jgi:SAM-dependent methyltransferase